MAHSSAREYPWSRLDSDNLTSLEELTEKALLAATKQRYSANLIYTDVGDILVAVNPFQELPSTTMRGPLLTAAQTSARFLRISIAWV